MGTLIEILVGWICVSCIGGPLLTWAVFYSKREAKAAYDHWLLTHPTSSFELMPARLKCTGRCSPVGLIPALR
jgi:hypothetical protein